MGAFANLKNQRFGRLVVIEKCGKAQRKTDNWDISMVIGNIHDNSELLKGGAKE